MLAPCHACTRPHLPRRGQGRARHQRRRVMHAREHRVVLGAQAEVQHRRVRLRVTRLPHRGDVPLQMHHLQVPVGGRRRRLDRHPGRREHAERAGQLHRHLHPHRRHRMPGPEVITRQPVIPGHMQRTRHMPLKHAAAMRAIHQPSPTRPRPDGRTTPSQAAGPIYGKPAALALQWEAGGGAFAVQGRFLTGQFACQRTGMTKLPCQRALRP